MPRSADRKSLELPAYLYGRLAAEAARRGQTTAGLAAEIIATALMDKDHSHGTAGDMHATRRMDQ